MTQTLPTKPVGKVRISKKPHAPRPSRRRISRACDRCKVKKTRCDGQEPCEKCREAENICSFTIKRSRDSRNYYLRMHNIYEDAVQQLFSICRDNGGFSEVIPFDRKNSDEIRTSQIFEALGLVRPEDKKSHSATSWQPGDTRVLGPGTLVGAFSTQQHFQATDMDDDAHTEFEYEPSAEDSLDPLSPQSSPSSGQTSSEATDVRTLPLPRGPSQHIPDPQNMQVFQEILSPPEQQQYQIDYWQQYQLMPHLAASNNIPPAGVGHLGLRPGPDGTMNPMHSASGDPWLAAWRDSSGGLFPHSVQH